MILSVIVIALALYIIYANEMSGWWILSLLAAWAFGPFGVLIALIAMVVIE